VDLDDHSPCFLTPCSLFAASLGADRDDDEAKCAESGIRDELAICLARGRDSWTSDVMLLQLLSSAIRVPLSVCLECRYPIAGS
jgi:hypothetical protein